MSEQVTLQLRRPPTHTRSSSISSFQSTLSNLKRGPQYLGALVAVVRSSRYIYRQSPIFLLLLVEYNHTSISNEYTDQDATLTSVI